RGAGKSTELRRLRRDLSAAGYLVLLFDVGDYLSPSAPIDISDFVIVVAGAMSDELENAGVLNHAATHESYWKRLTHFMQSRVEFQEIVGTAGAVSVKASLRTDPTFRRRVQESAAGHLAELDSGTLRYTMGAAHPSWVYPAGMARTIQVRDVPDEIHRELRARAVAADTSLSAYVLEELKRIAGRP